MSKNKCKLRHKVRNTQNLPHVSANFKYYYFLSNFTHIFLQFFTNLRSHYENRFFLYFSFLTLNPRCLGTCVNCVTNYVKTKRALVQLLHGQMKLDLYIVITSLLKISCTISGTSVSGTRKWSQTPWKYSLVLATKKENKVTKVSHRGGGGGLGPDGKSSQFQCFVAVELFPGYLQWSSGIFIDFCWSSAVIGNLWQSLAIFGDLRLYVVIFVNLWWSLTIFGDLW